jgi:hypothetical protein
MDRAKGYRPAAAAAGERERKGLESLPAEGDAAGSADADGKLDVGACDNSIVGRRWLECGRIRPWAFPSGVRPSCVNEPQFAGPSAMPLLNLHRCHLTSAKGQRVAVEIEPPPS